MTVRRPAALQGELRPPSDKSLTHRAYMLGAIASGVSTVRNPLRGEDCEATLRCLAQMGTEFDREPNGDTVLRPVLDWRSPSGSLDCGNSGTTARLLSGLIASRPLEAEMVGDSSLSGRPMKRIAEPLRLMGAELEGDSLPLRIRGTGQLRGIAYEAPVASAQIKSCILLAGLRASGETWVREPHQSRDHTERMLAACGVDVLRGSGVGVRGGSTLASFELTIPADISSAAFLMCAAAMLPESRIRLVDVGVNPTRAGILDVFGQAGVPCFLDREREELGEPVADVEVASMGIGSPFAISAGLVPRLIDEIPVLAVLATQLDGVSTVRGASELRVKESDRIAKVTDGLRAMGASVEAFDDGLAVEGPVRLKGATIDAQGDHRIAMAFAIAGLVASGETVIDGADSIATSYPEFELDLWKLCVL